VARILANKDDLLRVLDRPEIPLNTNTSETDVRSFVTKRKISGETRSTAGKRYLPQPQGCSVLVCEWTGSRKASPDEG
jgi:hypothetical protein